jgi:hypothetical protein
MTLEPGVVSVRLTTPSGEVELFPGQDPAPVPDDRTDPCPTCGVRSYRSPMEDPDYRERYHRYYF